MLIWAAVLVPFWPGYAFPPRPLAGPEIWGLFGIPVGVFLLAIPSIHLRWYTYYAVFLAFRYLSCHLVQINETSESLGWTHGLARLLLPAILLLGTVGLSAAGAALRVALQKRLFPRAGPRDDARLPPISAILEGWEQRWGLYRTAALVGIALLACAAVYVTPALHAVGHGVIYQRMSVAPFDFSSPNPLQFRILTPLFAHLLFLRGEAYVLLPLAMAAILLSAVYAYLRKRHDATPVVALTAAALLAFSSPVFLVLHFLGLVDITSYLLIWLCLATRRPLLQVVWFALALLNHESCAFALPFLAWRPWQTGEAWRRTSLRLFFLLVAAVPLLVYRLYVGSRAEILFSSDFYLSFHFAEATLRSIAAIMPVGVFQTFRLFWLLPIFAVACLWKTQRRPEALWIALVVACALAQLTIAHDVSRLVGLAFPAILFGADALRRHWGEALYRNRLGWLFVFNLLVPAYYIGPRFFLLIPLPATLVLRIFGIDAWEVFW